MAPNVTGVYGCRKVVVPISGIGFPEDFRKRANPVDGARSALVGAHAQRRVALDVLDHLVALAGGDRYVGRRRVGLEIDEALARPRHRLGSRHDPTGAIGRFGPVVGVRSGRGGPAVAESGIAGRGRAGRRALRE